MRVRRLTTGQRPDGRSVVADDTSVEGITTALMPGLEFHRLWAQDAVPDLPSDGAVPRLGPYFPEPGGFRFGLFTIPPDAEVPLDEAARDEAVAKIMTDLPGLLEHMEPDHPGMHTTDTVDFEYIISGEVWLELDDGQEVHLKAGDTVVQNGTRHAWRNKSKEPCTMVFCMIGARRS